MGDKNTGDRRLNEVKTWTSLHRLELRRAWKALEAGAQPKEIKPLKKRPLIASWKL